MPEPVRIELLETVLHDVLEEALGAVPHALALSSGVTLGDDVWTYPAWTEAAHRMRLGKLHTKALLLAYCQMLGQRYDLGLSFTEPIHGRYMLASQPACHAARLQGLWASVLHDGLLCEGFDPWLVLNRQGASWWGNEGDTAPRMGSGGDVAGGGGGPLTPSPADTSASVFNVRARENP